GTERRQRQTFIDVRNGRCWIAIALLAVTGALLFGQGAYIFAKAKVAQVLLHASWARSQATGLPVRPWPWADTYPVARLSAPSQKADLLILSGASGRSLAFGPGHLDGSPPPGASGNSVVLGHR